MSTRRPIRSASAAIGPTPCRRWISRLDLPAGRNQPLWVLIHVPRDARPGDYAGNLTLKAEGWSAAVPLRLHVWNFTLPERNHIATAFGSGPGSIINAYQHLKTDADKRRVLDMYLESFAEHRISPYDPAPLDPIRVKFLPEADPPRAEVDFSAFDPAMARAIEKYHFTNYPPADRGHGRRTFHGNVTEPSIAGFGEKTPQYQAMFSSYVKQLEDHLRKKGWLDMPYIYWFDEPEPNDYAFVRAGMERLKKYAPGLTTMLTEQPEEALAGPVDIWCPVTFNYNSDATHRRQAQGERILVVRLLRPEGPVLHAVHRPPRHRAAGLALADLAAARHRRAGLAARTTGTLTAEPRSESVPGPDGLRQAVLGLARDNIGATATGGSSIRRWPPSTLRTPTGRSSPRRYRASAGRCSARGSRTTSICGCCGTCWPSVAARCRPSR